jgi:hypothetical protein
MKDPTTPDTDQPPAPGDEWTTAEETMTDEPMTDAQRSYLEELCRQTGEAFDEKLTRADASKWIEVLRARLPRDSQD